MNQTLGSLQSFLPNLSTANPSCKTLALSTRKLQHQDTKKSENALKFTIKSCLGIRNSETSQGGYHFVNSIKDAQERMKVQSQQRPRNISSAHVKGQRPKTTIATTRSRITTEAKNEIKQFEIPLQEDLLEVNIRNELQY